MTRVSRPHQRTSAPPEVPCASAPHLLDLLVLLLGDEAEGAAVARVVNPRVHTPQLLYGGRLHRRHARRLADVSSHAVHLYDSNSSAVRVT